MEHSKPQWRRRGVLAGLSGLAVASGGRAQPAQAVFAMPDGACDSHFHIYDPRFAYQPDAVLKPPFATIGQLGKASRGVAVCHADVAVADLKRMHGAGVRGVRFQLSRGALIAPEEILPLARRIAKLQREACHINGL